MSFSISVSKKISEKTDLVLLIKPSSGWQEYLKENHEIDYVKRKITAGDQIILVNQFTRNIILLVDPEEKTGYKKAEKLRKAGHDLSAIINKEKIQTIQIAGDAALLPLIEGLLLASYQFLKYKTDKKANTLTTVEVISEKVTQAELDELNHIVQAVYITRDLVNEPVIYLTAEQFSEDIVKLGAAKGFSTEVFNKSKIQSLKMGGLLAVNTGSPNPPTFTILEYKPANAKNIKPVILVGKGVVYDTGGLSLKPTEHSMDMMKCDMAGAAAVVGAFCAIADNKIPVHIIGLIPATENRPDGNAITPGDVITMFSGKTVEVLNTDAEGRLILADALAYASKYEPSLVIDLATLTGSAVRAIGKEGIVYMGTAEEDIKKSFENSGNEVYERLVEFPMWDEYDEQIKSDIADLKNIGGSEAGAITAGKFMQHFTSYPWLHLDIAGGAFLTGKDSYRGLGGTGLGVRLLYHYLKNAI